MRVTNKMLSNSFMRDMRTNLRNMQILQKQMTTGKEVSKPSDDPFKVARSMQLHTDISTNKQYNENISDTINWLDTTDTSLGQAGNVLKRIHELLISAGNGGYGDGERKAIKDEINEKIGEFSQIMNTNFDGKYIFGGSRGTAKPVGIEGGVKYKDAKIIKIDDPKAFNEKKITFTDSQIKPPNTEPEKLEINIDDKSISDLDDLVNKINNAINSSTPTASPFKDKLKAVIVPSESSIMFVSQYDSDINITNSDASLPGHGEVITKTTVEDNGNARLSYYKKGGGELDITSADGSEDRYQLDMIGQKLKVEISQGVTMDYNVSASDVIEFKDDDGKKMNLMDIFNNITNHLDGMDTAGSTEDASSIGKLTEGDLKDVKSAIDNLLKIRSEVGAKQNRMDNAKERNTEENFNMTEILSHTEDIDVTEKTMEYATMQMVYMASLQTSAKVLQPSLMDFMR